MNVFPISVGGRFAARHPDTAHSRTRMSIAFPILAAFSFLFSASTAHPQNIGIGTAHPRVREGQTTTTATDATAQLETSSAGDDLLIDGGVAAPVALDEMQQALLAAIAGYPDEILVAIFEVAQDPQRIVASEPGNIAPPTRAPNALSAPAAAKAQDINFRRAYETLAIYPEIIVTLEKYPDATGAVGDLAREHLAETWHVIDRERTEMPEEPLEIDAELELPEEMRTGEPSAMDNETAILVEEHAMGQRERTIAPEVEMRPVLPVEPVEPPRRVPPPPAGPDLELEDVLPPLSERTPPAVQRNLAAVRRASRADLTPPPEFDPASDDGTTRTPAQRSFDHGGRYVPANAEQAVDEQHARVVAGLPALPGPTAPPPDVGPRIGRVALAAPETRSMLEEETPAQVARARRFGVVIVNGAVGPGRFRALPRGVIPHGSRNFTRPQFTQQYNRYESLHAAQLRSPSDIRNVIRGTSVRHERFFNRTNQYFGTRVGRTSGSRHTGDSPIYGD